jgi:hypothetical protein
MNFLKTKNATGFGRSPQSILKNVSCRHVFPYSTNYENNIPPKRNTRSIVPFHKKGDKTKIKKLHLLSNLLSSGKVFEKLNMKRI